MKNSYFSLIRLDDFVRAKESECRNDPFLNTPFGSESDGFEISEWQMNLNRLGLYNSMGGRNLFGRSGMVIITVNPTETGIRPLPGDSTFGWEGKINESTAEMAICRAFELFAGDEATQFMKEHKPSVEFSYIDSDGPGEISVKYNGEYWIITG